MIHSTFNYYYLIGFENKKKRFLSNLYEKLYILVSTSNIYIDSPYVIDIIYNSLFSVGSVIVTANYYESYLSLSNCEHKKKPAAVDSSFDPN